MIVRVFGYFVGLSAAQHEHRAGVADKSVLDAEARFAIASEWVLDAAISDAAIRLYAVQVGPDEFCDFTGWPPRSTREPCSPYFDGFGMW